MLLFRHLVSVLWIELAADICLLFDLYQPEEVAEQVDPEKTP
jgi:hypothetical protein